MAIVSAGGIVWRKTDKEFQVKLIYTSKKYWTLPKGRVEENEDIKKAAIREVWEESGVQAKIDLFVGNAEWKLKSGETKIVHLYLMELIKDGEPNDPDGESVRAEWKSLHEAIVLVDFPPLRNILVDVITILINRDLANG